MTEAEAAAFERRKRLQENSQAKDDIHYDNVIWQSEGYEKTVSRRERRRSTIRPTKIPSLTPEEARRGAAIRRGSADSAQSRTLGERCISRGNEGPPMLGANYNANLQILQTERGHHSARDDPRHSYHSAGWPGAPRHTCASWAAIRVAAGRPTR